MTARSVRLRPWLLGVAVLAVYVAVAVATLALSGRRVLPLFEGVGPPRAYQWVHPPPQFASGNIKPKPNSEDIPFTGGKTPATVVNSSDTQFILNLPAGAFAPHENDTAVHAAITPLAPATLPPVPAGLVADGNAYRIELDYRPSGVAVTRLAVDSDVIMAAPHQAQALLYSPDGRSWSTLPTQPAGSPSSVGATFTSPGWYLVAANPSALPSSSHSRSGTIAIAVGTGVAAIILAVVGRTVAVRRRRTSPARPPARPTGQRPHRRRPPPRKRR